MKPLIIQTTPHTGTHTAMYLFSYLGGIPAFYMHFGDWELSEFIEVIGDRRERLQFVQTFRPYQDIVATYKKREAPDAVRPDVPYGSGNSAEELVDRNMIVARRWQEEFLESLILPIGVNVELQSGMARQIFEACGYEVPDTAKRFLETWPPKGTFSVAGGMDDWRGFDTAAEWQDMRRLMQTQRVMPSPKDRLSKDWDDKLNLALKELSN